MNILLIRRGGIGDVLLMTAVLSEMRARAPRVEFYFQTDYPELLLYNADVAATLPGGADVECDHYDLRLDFTGACETRSVLPGLGLVDEKDYMTVPRLELLRRHAGLCDPSTGRSMVYYVTGEEKEVARGRMAPSGAPLVVLGLNTTSTLRTWPIELACETVRILSRRCRVVLLGDPRRRWGANHPFVTYLETFKGHNNPMVLDLSDRLTLREAAAVVSIADAAVLPDSGLGHLAAALGVPAVHLFGNIDPWLRLDVSSPRRVALLADIPCRPDCGDRFSHVWNHCPSWREIDGPCRRIGAACMWRLTSDQVSAEVFNLLGKFNRGTTGAQDH